MKVLASGCSDDHLLASKSFPGNSSNLQPSLVSTILC